MPTEQKQQFCHLLEPYHNPMLELFGPGVGTNVKINFGECLLLCSDVVHAGGRPGIEK